MCFMNIYDFNGVFWYVFNVCIYICVSCMYLHIYLMYVYVTTDQTIATAPFIYPQSVVCIFYVMLIKVI